jgi:hypothetical protein
MPEGSWCQDLTEDDDFSAPHEPNFQGPFTSSKNSPSVSSCPKCQAGNIEARHYGRRVGSAIGTVAGAVRSASAALAGAETGAAFGLVAGGPIGSACGGIAGAVVAALVGGTAGGAIGAAIGEMADTNILNNYRCHACGHTFSLNKP